MMAKKIQVVWTALFIVLFIGIANTDAEETVTVSKKYLENLEKRISRLEKEQASRIDPKTITRLSEDVEDLVESMEMVERKSFVDKLSWGVELRNRVNWFQYEDKTAGSTLHTDELYQTRLRLNIFAEVTDNLKFSGRLTGYWNWGDTRGQAPITGSSNIASLPTDTTLRVERAYMDYFFESIPFCLTLGRQPSAGGPPSELRQNRVRKST